MSITASKWAWEQKISPSEKLVLLVIADHADDQGGSAFPSLERMAQRTGLSRRTVIRAVQALANAGLVAVGKMRGRINACNTYSLALKGVVTPCHSGSDTVTPDPSYIRQININKRRAQISEDWKMSERNCGLAASLGLVPRSGGGSSGVEDVFRDWALMHGFKSANWQTACSTFIKKYAHEEQGEWLYKH